MDDIVKGIMNTQPVRHLFAGFGEIAKKQSENLDKRLSQIEKKIESIDKNLSKLLKGLGYE